jgi:hypothetical protein
MSTKYTNVQVRVTDAQKDKLRKAVSSGCATSIRLAYEDLSGDDVLAVTQVQANKLAKAYENKKGMILKMSKAQLAHNMKTEGGFLPMLAGLAAKALPLLTRTILPALGVGALSGLASTAVNKAMGDGLYLKRGSGCCKVVTDGSGLYLSSANGNGFEKFGLGLYLIKEGRAYDGSGLLLGENSPFKNIPILGMLL